MEWSGVEWSVVEWSGVECGRVEWSGVECGRVEWSGMEWSGVWQSRVIPNTYLGVSTNFSTRTLSSPKAALDSLLHDSRRLSKSLGSCTILIPCSTAQH